MLRRILALLGRPRLIFDKVKGMTESLRNAGQCLKLVSFSKHLRTYYEVCQKLKSVLSHRSSYTPPPNINDVLPLDTLFCSDPIAVHIFDIPFKQIYNAFYLFSSRGSCFTNQRSGGGAGTPAPPQTCTPQPPPLEPEAGPNILN